MHSPSWVTSPACVISTTPGSVSIDGTEYLCLGGGVNSSSIMVQSTQCYDLAQSAPGVWNAENAQIAAFPTDPFGAADGILHAPTGDQFWFVGGAVQAGADPDQTKLVTGMMPITPGTRPETPASHATVWKVISSMVISTSLVDHPVALHPLVKLFKVTLMELTGYGP